VTYFYKAYNLRVRSAFEVPEMLPIPPIDPVDVTIRISNKDFPPLHPVHPLQVFPEGVVYRWYRVGTVMIREGREIILDPLPDAEPTLSADIIANNAMAIILHQRGFFVMHASAVLTEHGAVAFAGESGFGKSTTAASFGQRGFTILSDDIVSLDLSAANPVPLMSPAFPQLKLLPDAVESLIGGVDALPLQFESAHKYVYRQDNHFPDAPQPLRAIYLLDRGDETRIEPVPPRQALLELFPHSYIARQLRMYNLDMLRATKTEGTHFINLSRLATQVPVRRLRRSFAPGELALLPDLISEDLAHL